MMMFFATAPPGLTPTISKLPVALMRAAVILPGHDLERVHARFGVRVRAMRNGGAVRRKAGDEAAFRRASGAALRVDAARVLRLGDEAAHGGRRDHDDVTADRHRVSLRVGTPST